MIMEADNGDRIEILVGETSGNVMVYGILNGDLSTVQSYEGLNFAEELEKSASECVELLSINGATFANYAVKNGEWLKQSGEVVETTKVEDGLIKTFEAEIKKALRRRHIL